VAKEKNRMIDDYKVVNSMFVGVREFALCENLKAPDKQYYMVCEVRNNGMFEYYDDIYQNEDYLMAMKNYFDRLDNQLEKIVGEYIKEGVPKQLITADMCNQEVFGENLEGKILVVKPSSLRPEYRTASNQIIRCTGGNGARPGAIGNAIFNYRLLDGEQSRWERFNILGELKPEHYPEWLIDVLECEKAMKNPNTFQYGEYHFLPVGNIPKNEPIYKTSQYLHSDKDMRMWSETYEDVHGKADKIYSHSEFYKASGNSKCDVFKCLENRKLYLPGEHELFEYTGKFKEVGKEKKKSHKEVER